MENNSTITAQEARHLAEAEVREALKSGRCACGAKKDPDQGFCIRCLHSLPLNYRGELNASMKDGYAIHHLNALAWLREHASRVKAVAR